LRFPFSVEALKVPPLFVQPFSVQGVDYQPGKL